MASATAGSPARDAAKAAKLVRIGRFSAPVYVTAPPGDRTRLFVVEKRGRIWVLHGRRRVSAPFLDLRKPVRSSGHEQGLFSMAFAPDYDSSRRFYVCFTDSRGDVRIEEFRASSGNPDQAERGSERLVLRVRHRSHPNHNGGQIEFGPDDLLYASFGDGGGARDPSGNGQDLGTLLGKIVRIDPRPSGGRPYGIPAGNPFRGRKRARAEIYAYGLRNPWRFSFDRSKGDLVIADVGAGRGANFGWSRFEGRRRLRRGSAPGHVKPVIQRFHSRGNCSITGGYVVRDRSLDSLYGRYVYGDFCNPKLRSARLRRPSARGDRSVGVRVSALSSFGQDGQGRIYAVSLRGRVYRLAAR